ncbi:MAG: hypothetical protein LBN39_02520 [Planctomycetaceae bacterium]|jgi:hypothetical protein|nr:hypothetical protein [Planctomycetaceae bacterium]
MSIIWDTEKDKWLNQKRELSFEPFVDIISAGQYAADIDNPVRGGQRLYIINYEGYTYAVPYIKDGQGNTILKTVYPSRKYRAIYGETKND